ncbi:predicted protein [Histoplasma capsulatum H143]|uniref:Uncharacterized protein n=1 Tax=Ajellomyces capsulatus (strain H143) TaxID=544712 RepID=C6H6X9_AJECH|nr:predicted protein [Histoplasma capsulatum H143]
MDGAPRHVVEAQSYGPLITLAANPPRYPRNPCKAPLKPLVLYIVRVPGSRDVFLSPLKPPTECSISPALIEAALYYIHVSTPEDEAVLSAIEKEKCLKEAPLEANRPPFPVAPSVRLQRKPVPRGEGTSVVTHRAMAQLGHRQMDFQTHRGSPPSPGDLYHLYL